MVEFGGFPPMGCFCEFFLPWSFLLEMDWELGGMDWDVLLMGRSCEDVFLYFLIVSWGSE